MFLKGALAAITMGIVSAVLGYLIASHFFAMLIALGIAFVTGSIGFGFTWLIFVAMLASEFAPIDR